MSSPSDALVTFIATSATYRYIWVAGYAWVLYDWLITLDQEIDLVWRQRSGAWKSKFLYAVTRYQGLALATFNIIVIMRTNWSARFCHVYFELTGVFGIAQMCAAQGALLLRLYVMYHRSFTVMAISITFFVIELVSMVTLWFLDVEHFIPLPIPAPATGCQALTQHPALAKAYWLICLIFETYMCGLALWSAYSHRKASGISRPNVLKVLIRDSLVWYVCLSVCLFFNALGIMTGTLMLTLIGVPAMQCTATVGGSRFLLNLRAAYFGSIRNTTSTSSGRIPRGTDFTQTKGTVGMFRSFASNIRAESEDGERHRDEGSIEMGLWANESSCPHDDDRPSSPSAMIRASANRRRQRACSAQGSSSAGPREPSHHEGLGLSASDLSTQPSHSSMRLCDQQPKGSDFDIS